MEWTGAHASALAEGVAEFGNNAELICEHYLPDKTPAAVQKVIDNKINQSLASTTYVTTEWTREESEALLRALQNHTKSRVRSWEQLSRSILPSRSPKDIERYFEEHFNRHHDFARNLYRNHLVEHKRSKCSRADALASQVRQMGEFGYTTEAAKDMADFLHLDCIPRSQVESAANRPERAAPPAPPPWRLPNRFLPHPAKRHYATIPSGKLACVFDPQQRFTGSFSVTDRKRGNEYVAVFADENRVFGALVNDVRDEVSHVVRHESASTVPQIMQLAQMQHPSGEWFATRHYHELNLFGVAFDEHRIEHRQVLGKSPDVLHHLACSPYDPASVAVLSGKSTIGLLDLTAGFSSCAFRAQPEHPHYFASCEFGAHPQLVDVLTLRGLLGFDFRAPGSRAATQFNLNTEDELEHMLAFGRVPQSRFEYVLLTTAEARLVDIRYPKQCLGREPHAIPLVNESRIDRHASRLELVLAAPKQALAFQTCESPVVAVLGLDPLQFRPSHPVEEPQPLIPNGDFVFPTCEHASVLGAGLVHDRWVVLSASYSHRRKRTTDETPFKPPLLCLSKLRVDQEV